MRTAGLRARVARIYRSNPGVHDFYGQYPNRLWKRRARARDQIWVADITYLSVAGQWRYLAVVIDQYSRRVVGWSLGRRRGADLTRAAFHLALRRRRPKKGLIFHSDRGSEYGGRRFGDRLKHLGLRQSMTRGGSPGDNAHAESFFHSLKADVVHGVTFPDDRQLRRCVASYIGYYNRTRLHSSLGYRSPVEYERHVA
jgi:transposase InsO family protein